MQSLAKKILTAADDLRRLNAGWYPTEEDLVDAVGLEDWSIISFPDSQTEVLCGSSIGHPQLGNRLMSTSNLLWISDDRKIARTLSRWYRLGSPAQPAAAVSSLGDPDMHDPRRS